MSSLDKHILWYVSAHGWGHAARQRELIRVLKEKRPKIRITLVSAAPDWFWRGSPIERLLQGTLSPIAMEKGGVPQEALTAQNLSKFVLLHDDLLREVIAAQKELKADLVITDIDPLPVAAAFQNNIPAVGIGNFTWDWILRRMCPGQHGEISLISEMYSTGTYLRLPLGPDYSPFRTTVDAPLLRGGSRGDANRIKHLLPESSLVCLVAFRQLPLGFPLDVPEGFTVVTSLPESQNPQWLNITQEELEKRKASFADLVDSADVVVTKPGYGIVSQVLSMGKRAVFLPQGVFPEEEYLLSPMKERRETVIASGPDMRRVFNLCAELAKDEAPLPVKADGSGFLVDYLEKMLI